MHGLTWTLYDITPLYVWYLTHYIYDIIYNIYDITHTAFMTTQRLYLTFHPLYLTSEPLYQCCHTRCINDITSMEVITLGIRMTSYTFYMKSHWQFMLSLLSIYDITTTIFDMYPRYLCHHIHCIDAITPTVFMRSHLLYTMTSYPLYTTTYSLDF